MLFQMDLSGIVTDSFLDVSAEEVGTMISEPVPQATSTPIKEAPVPAERKHLCTECGKAYMHRRSLMEHCRKHHSAPGSGPNFSCALCEKTFMRADELQAHTNTVHTNQKPFQCEICKRSFVCKRNARPYRHACHMASTESVKYKCTWPSCGKEFRAKHYLKEHENIHKNPGRYRCHVCFQSFTFRQQLLRHTKYCSV